MTIEVKQLHIKSTVLQESGAANRDRDSDLDLADMREEILAECKQQFIRMLRAQQER
jgi:hypothetical protein